MLVLCLANQQSVHSSRLETKLRLLHMAAAPRRALLALEAIRRTLRTLGIGFPGALGFARPDHAARGQKSDHLCLALSCMQQPQICYC